ncbi:MAG: FAD-binding protein [Anaerolineae bacterium]|nr:FAD-binding protein [Anaerolineae bacterium]
MYARVDRQVIARLQEIVGAAHVLSAREEMEPYSHDEVPELRAWPEVVVKPGSAAEVAEILRLANERHIPVTPRGGGQGLSGGAVPIYGGIVLSVERMNRILEIDHRNLMVTVEPGVITGDLHRAVEAEGLFYPPDPASLDSCFIGGNIAEGAGGPRAVKYGTTKDYVCGLEVVLPTGEIISLGGKLVKDVAGYNLIQLMVGSEGTLGIVTKIILRLLPLPRAQVDLLVPFDDFGKAADTVADIIAHCVVPTAIEFMEREAVQACERLLKKEVPFSDAEAHLLIQLTGQHEEALEAELDEVGELCLEHGALDVLVAQDRPTRDRLWEARRMILEALNHESPVNHTEDVSVPRSEIPALLKGVHELSRRLGIRALSFGHAGDGNVHVNFLKDDLSEEEWRERLRQAQEELYRLTLALGGTITGEHGIGSTRREFLSRIFDETTITLMRRIKDAFDPNHILNPGKIFPEE